MKTLPDNIRAPLVVIVGPTAVGKTEIALRLAERLDGEVISADSRLFYRGMDIGTAKPTPEEMARVPHHLIDVADPDETWSLAHFQNAARVVIADIHRRGRLPFLVGGTGQYVRAVIEGWDLPDQQPDHALRDALERWALEIGGDGLYARLKVLDPEAAELIDSRNVRRTIRALEVTLRTGRKFSEQRLKSASPFSLMMLGLTRPRPELYDRIDRRIEGMLAAGLVDEVRKLLERGYSPALPTMSAIGYREVCAHLRGEMSLEDAVVLMKRHTRRFVRHQGAWFREEDPTIHWFQVESDIVDQTVDQIEALLRSDAGWVAAESKEDRWENDPG